MELEMTKTNYKVLKLWIEEEQKKDQERVE